MEKTPKKTLIELNENSWSYHDEAITYTFSDLGDYEVDEMGRLKIFTNIDLVDVNGFSSNNDFKAIWGNVEYINVEII